MDKRFGILLICCMAIFMTGIDALAVNLALPTLQREFSASVSHLQWVVDSYTVTLATLLIFSGSMADRIGRKRVFVMGLVLFGLGSLLCSMADSMAYLIVARFIQAIGGSALNPVAMAIISNIYRDPKERAKAIGIWGATIGLSFVVGPLIGGVLVEYLGWRSIFWINIPLVMVAVFLTLCYVPESKSEHKRKFDYAGQLLVLVGMLSLVASIIELSNHLLPREWVYAGFLLSALCFVLLIWVEKRVPDPLLQLSFFKSVPFSGSMIIAVLAFASMSGFGFLATLYMQKVRELSVIQAALMMFPQALMMLIMPIVSSRMLANSGARKPLLLAGLSMAVGFSLFTQIEADTPLYWVILALMSFGLGFGSINAPITNSAVSGMPRSQAGTAGALTGVSRMFGSALGVALFGSLTERSVDVEHFKVDFAPAMHPSMWVMLVIALVICVLAYMMTGAKAMATNKQYHE